MPPVSALPESAICCCDEMIVQCYGDGSKVVELDQSIFPQDAKYDSYLVSPSNLSV